MNQSWLSHVSVTRFAFVGQELSERGLLRSCRYPLDNDESVGRLLMLRILVIVALDLSPPTILPSATLVDAAVAKYTRTATLKSSELSWRIGSRTSR